MMLAKVGKVKTVDFTRTIYVCSSFDTLYYAGNEV